MASAESPRLHSYLVASREGRADKVVVWDTARIRIGRHYEQDIVLIDPEVSRQHALLRREGESFFVEDLGTANGTSVNGELLREPHELRPDDTVRVGGCSFRFCQSVDDPSATLANVIPASRLRGAQPLSEDAHDSTLLGLPADEDELWGPGPRADSQPATRPVVRDLDGELALPEKDDSDFASPDDPDPLMASAFDLGEPLPPVGPAPGQAPGADRSAGHSAPTVPTYGSRADAPEGRSIELTLQLDGVAPELLRALQALLGQRFDLRALSLFLKALSIR
jgi:pSer/pThr/pTyr-binding forkhead associated (FHA) protein